MATQAEVMPDLRKLASLSQLLNSESDSLGQSLQRLQDDLNAMHIGLEVWPQWAIDEGHWDTVLDRDENDTGDRQRTVQQVGYGRLGDGWGLLTRSGREVERPGGYGNPEYEYVDMGHPQSLLRASREIRLKTVPHLPDLIAAIEAEVAEAVKRVATARKLAE
jgi:hypothetical protein